MASPINDQVGQYYTSAGLLTANSCCFQKVICSASSSGTLTVYDGTSAAGTRILNVFPLTAGNVYEFDIMLSAGCFTVVGGTATLVFLVGP